MLRFDNVVLNEYYYYLNGVAPNAIVLTLTTANGQ